MLVPLFSRMRSAISALCSRVTQRRRPHLGELGNRLLLVLGDSESNWSLNCMKASRAFSGLAAAASVKASKIRESRLSPPAGEQAFTRRTQAAFPQSSPLAGKAAKSAIRSGPWGTVKASAA
jgi:hypothetical protein